MDKLDIGKLTEDQVQAAVERAFGPDFVFRSPHRENKKEATDVLVLFDDVALILQCKAQAIETSGPAIRDPREWALKNLNKAARQAGGAARTVREGRLQYVENERRGRVAFDATAYPHRYGLIVISHDSTPYDPYALSDDLRGIDLPTQVLSFADFVNVTALLDTPGDLINYIEHRGDVLVPQLAPQVHEEERVLGYYLDHLEDVTLARAAAQKVPLTRDQIEPYARELRLIADGRHPDFDAGRFIDSAIDYLHDVDPDCAVPFGDANIQSGVEHYATVATEIAKLVRVRRIRIGRIYLNLISHAARAGADMHKIIRSTRRNQCILLMASIRPANERVERAEDLLMYTTLAKDYYGYSTAIGIATEGAVGRGRSFDAVWVELAPNVDERTMQLGREVFGEKSLAGQ